MAEGVLFHVAMSILTKLGSPAMQEIGLLWGLQDDFEKLKVTVETIKAVLLDAEKQYRMRNEVRVWLDALRDAAYDADDLLDDMATEVQRQQLKSGGVVTKKIEVFFFPSNRLAYGLKMAHKIKDIRAKLDYIAETRKFHLEQHLVEPTVADHGRDTHSSVPNIVVGRENDKKEIMSLLLADHEHNMMAIPIVGLGGLGKTTLAQMIYNDEIVRGHFELKVWICVSDVFDIKLIIEKVIECIDGKKPKGNLELETLKNQLGEKIKGKKYLFVLDDIWTEDREKWVQLNDLIIGGTKGSRIILTTRNKTVAEITSTFQDYYELKGLSKLESWDLFKKVAFKRGEAPNEEFEKLGKEIVEKCGGLPLAIRTIGSLLYTRRKESEWQHFKDEEFSKLDPKNNIVETLKLSYNHLPSNLKYCFAYCSLFPKDYIFNVSTLIHYWEAQGYVGTRNESTSYEDKGINCFTYLLRRSFFQVEEENENGEIVKCRMHDFMHDLAMLVAGEEIKLIHGGSNKTIVPEKTRHLSLLEVRDEAQWQYLAPLLQRKKARSLIIQPNFKGLNDKRLHVIVDKLRCLRVLVLESGGFKKLPGFIDRLNHLRQLDLSRNRITKLPNSITQLHNLEVLNLDYCWELQKLPKDMKKLVNLVHLGLEECRRLEEMPQGIGQLTSLEVLSQFSLSKKRRLLHKATGGLDELQKLNKLRGTLKIVKLECVKKGASECEAANLKDKPHLQSLTLQWHWRNYEVSSEEKSFEALQPHVNLKELIVYGYRGPRFPRWVSSLENLVKINFGNCSNCKSLPRLDELPSLQHLQVWGLEELEYMIDNNRNTNGASMPCFFPSLETLTLIGCYQLKGWWRTNASTTEEPLHYQLPHLSELDINRCHNFKGWMPQLPNLNTLTLCSTRSELLEETLKQTKPPLSITGSRTTTSPLRSLTIADIEGLGLLQEEAFQSLASVQSLRVIYCKEMKSLPQGIQHLTSLETLEINDCDDMESLPEWMGNLTSLNSLGIYKCPHLRERCGSNQGEDWPSISHIPDIRVHYNWVQTNGIYRSQSGK